VWSYVDEMLEEKDLPRVQGWLDVFNNCRETGYMCRFYSFHEKLITKKNLCFWVFEHRNSDDIVVVTSNKVSANGIFDSDAYAKRAHFDFDEERRAARYIINTITEYFKLEKEKEMD
jgi:hypothetical protein